MNVIVEQDYADDRLVEVPEGITMADFHTLVREACKLTTDKWHAEFDGMELPNDETPVEATGMLPESRVRIVVPIEVVAKAQLSRLQIPCAHPALMVSFDDALRNRKEEPLRWILRSGLVPPNQIRKRLLSRPTDESLLKFVFDAGLSPDFGTPPLLLDAITNSNAALVRILLDRGADPDAGRQSRTTPLLQTVTPLQTATVASLIAAHANCNARGSSGETPLMGLVSNKEPVDEVLSTLALMLDAGAEVNVARNNGWTPLSIACGVGVAPVVAKLLSAGARADTKDDIGSTPLHGMCKANIEDDDIVDMLVAAGADVNAVGKDGQTPLHAATQSASITRMLLRNKADPNLADTRHRSPLHITTSGPVADALVEDGADMNAKAKAGGQTPLHVACDKKRTDVAISLISHGADLDAQDNFKRTPLHFAAMRDCGAVAGELLKAGADAMPRTMSQSTPLHLAATNKASDAVRALLADTRTDVDARDNGGATPLLCAADVGAYEVVGLLLAAGADPRAADSKGRSPIDAAGKGHYKHCGRLLLDALAA